MKILNNLFNLISSIGLFPKKLFLLIGKRLVKAFVKLASGVEPNETTKHLIMDYCKQNIAKHAINIQFTKKQDKGEKENGS